MIEPFNKLTPAQAELLALLAEEAGEVVQAIGKILRHGYNSYHPEGGESNRQALQRELGDVQAAINLLIDNDDLKIEPIRKHCVNKLNKVTQYLHHYVNVSKDGK